MLFSKKFFINQIFWSLLAQKSSNRFQTSERTPGGAQWAETHSDPPKNPKNCVTVPKFTSTES